MSEPPANIQAEESVLGALMVSESMLRPVLIDTGLDRAHFFRDKHRLIFDAIRELAAENEPVDVVSVVAKLNGRLDRAGGREFVTALASTVTVAGNAAHYARLIVEAASLRAKLDGAQRIIAGVNERNDLAVQAGMEQLTRDLVAGNEPSDPQDISAELSAFLDAPGEPEVFDLPWPKLSDHIGAGGFLRGEFNLLIGWTNLGKSIVLDQMLTRWGEAGHRCQLFTTEMTRLERSMRYVSGKTRIPYGKLARRRLSDKERERVQEALDVFPFGIRTAQGWTVERITQEIVARQLDIAAIDPLNLIQYVPGQGLNRTQWMDDVLARLKNTALSADCLIIAVSQLNMTRSRDENPPPPALRDIRDSGTAQYIAHQILSFHREHRKGNPTKNGELRLLKVRNGVRGGCDVEFRTETLSVEEKHEEPSQEVMDYRSPATEDPLAGNPFDE